MNEDCSRNESCTRTKYSYDAFGNLTKSGTFIFRPGYNSNNQMTNGTSYDAMGDVLSDGLHSYAWNSDTRPTTIDSVTVTYDALGRMVEQNNNGSYTEIEYSPTGFKMQLLNGQSYIKQFEPFPGGAERVWQSSGPSYFRHADWLGSSRFASTTTRTMYNDLAFAPFGETYAATGSTGVTDISFAGNNEDTTTNLYDAQFREYGIQGRWPSPDPAGVAAANPLNPQSWNRYAYALNNPLGITDTSGLWCDPGYTACGPQTNDGGGGSVFDSEWVWVPGSSVGLTTQDTVSGPGFTWEDTQNLGTSYESGYYIITTYAALSAAWNDLVAGALNGSAPTSDQLTAAVAKGASLAGHVIPMVCGPVGIFGFAGGKNLNGLVELDSRSGFSAGVLAEGKVANVGGVPLSLGYAGTATRTGLQGEPLVFAGESAGAFSTISTTPQVGPFFGFDLPGTNLGAGFGVYATINSVSGCQQ